MRWKLFLFGKLLYVCGEKLMHVLQLWAWVARGHRCQFSYLASLYCYLKNSCYICGVSQALSWGLAIGDGCKAFASILIASFGRFFYIFKFNIIFRLVYYTIYVFYSLSYKRKLVGVGFILLGFFCFFDFLPFADSFLALDFGGVSSDIAHCKSPTDAYDDW